MTNIYDQLEAMLLQGLVESFPELSDDPVFVKDRMAPVVSKATEVITSLVMSSIAKDRKQLLMRITNEFTKGFQAPTISPEANASRACPRPNGDLSYVAKGSRGNPSGKSVEQVHRNSRS
jgi:hypothetical protein